MTLVVHVDFHMLDLDQVLGDVDLVHVDHFWRRPDSNPSSALLSQTLCPLDQSCLTLVEVHLVELTGQSVVLIRVLIDPAVHTNT